MADSANKLQAHIPPGSEDLVSSRIQYPPPNDPIVDAVDGRSECGGMQTSESEFHYVGNNHWATILDGIADLKDHLDRDEQFRLASTPSDLDIDEHENGLARPRSGYALLLYGGRRLCSKDEILAALPPRSAVDRYVSRYFNYLDLVSSSAVHGPSFLREYEAFWKNQSSAPVMWIGLLFSMICLACLTSDILSEPNPEDLSLQVDLYREKIVQCLTLGEYTRSGPYVLETVINYTYAEFCIRTDADKDIWYLLALEVNLAMRMGYHRDPSHFPRISPFQGEMRRRLWATVLMGDILISNQMGMPRMISDGKWDTSEPRNLNDTDFDEESTELPLSRPLTEYTNSLGIIARRRILAALGAVIDLTDAVKPCTYADVMHVDSMIQEAAASIPPPLKLKSMATSMTDTPQIIMARLFLYHMIYKGQVILHKRFFYPRSDNSEDQATSYSRKVCLEASLSTLEIQHVLDEETCPGGQLYTMRFRVTSIMNHQFLTATMILCCMLHRGQTLEREQDIRAALQRCRAIWMRRSESSKEAKKAAETVSFVMARADDGKSHNVALTQTIAHSVGHFPPNRVPLDSQEPPGSIPDEATVSSDYMSFFDPDYFVMTGSFGSFAPSGQPNQSFPQAQDFAIEFNGMERRPDEWMLMPFYRFHALVLMPDVYVRNGRHLVSRVGLDHDTNDRHSSQRRNILTAAKLSNSNVEMVGLGHGNEQSIELRHVSPLAVTDSSATATRTIQATYSLLQSVAVEAGCFLLCAPELI
ncbi:fungal-specific transcription factor [Penicillium odoratum]|uniref:fungal-specific transcription factor n=1 Tax=Penicillium odoratum TaxID=1167516 RepID=UPI00254848D9|nr:fungal-specific transcription factor [Penicillium odoratum]KAJ5753006.1 fungal-specific transcription factor [Penicillium odoratum]